MFGPGAIYTSVQWFWLLGACLPVLFYVLIQKFPRSPARLLNAPVFVSHPYFKICSVYLTLTSITECSVQWPGSLRKFDIHPNFHVPAS